ncbi:hypothetical protein SteCoe_10683 [Stentor coeruleus]|uniref:Piwi-like protein 05 n=1 Tax=Stentor coeruleus TaxID=5963 RepID=A0A060BQ68_9CILI|nr:piwi-like protein 05 [Stentor coeruleus]OMJ87591.1 hypothetical protein SteCoe_10683 [Stentor coeruleus]
MVERVNQFSGIARERISTNFYRLDRSPLNQISIYSYSFIPEIESDNRILRTQLLNKCKSLIEKKIGMFIRSGNTLFSKTYLSDSFSIPVYCHENTEYILVIILAGFIDKKNIDVYRMYSNSALKKMLQCLDLKQITKMPKYFDIRQTQRIEQHRLEVWRGYTASFSHNLKEMLLNIDFSSKIVRDTTVLQAMEEIRNRCRGQNLDANLDNELIGQTIMAKYGNFKCYRIEGIILNENPTINFLTKDGSLSYIEYFRKTYNININFTKQPLIKSYIEKGTKEIRLIPELCVLTGISEDMKKDYRAMNDIAAYTRLEPIKRFDVSMMLAKKLANNETCREICDEYNIHIDPTPIVVDGFRFDMEMIKIGEKNSDFVCVDKKGVFFVDNSILKAVEIKNWVVLTTERDAMYRDKLIKTLVNKAGLIGLKLGPAMTYEYHPKNVDSLIRSLGKQQNGPVPQIILVVVAPGDKKVYNDTKAICSLTLGIPTQCIKANNITNAKKFDSIMSKLIIQIAVKTGSLAWSNLHPVPNLPIRTMVVGIDVFHDTVQKAKSVLGFVASIHPKFTNYYNTVRIHEKSGQEIANNIGECMLEALHAFHKATKNRFMPEVIIIFRDGISDSQIKATKDSEVKSIKKMFLTDFQGYSPNLVYVIVNKNTNAKLFSKGTGGYTNPNPGTLVNSTIVPDEQSFYLISHYVTQGMVSPTLYRIIDNDGNIDLMIIARLAFKLCFMYYNWSGGIKIPAPTMMAHKLAFLVGQSIHQIYHEQLRLLPWFY